ELESTAAGCQWLLERWAELRARWDQDQTWDIADRLKALRLLGKPRVEASDDPIVTAVLPIRMRQEIVQAEHAALTGSDPDPLEASPADEEERRFEAQWQEQREAEEAAAAVALPGIVERAVARLKKLARGHRERAEADAAEAAARLAFDPSME